MGIFNITPYKNMLLCDAIGFMQSEANTSIWIEFLQDNKMTLLYGILESEIRNDFVHSHSKKICDIDLIENGSSSFFKNRTFKGNYRLYKVQNVFYLKIKINFIKSAVPDIEYNGPILHRADYRYYLGLDKKMKNERK